MAQQEWLKIKFKEMAKEFQDELKSDVGDVTKDPTNTLASLLQKAWANQRELRILVTGKTGQGKSTLINGILGTQVAIQGARAARCTTTVTEYKKDIRGVPVTVFDSPGLQDRTVNEEEYIQGMRDKCKELSLVVYCTKMINPRLTDDDKNAMVKLTKAFGEGFWNYAVFVLTFANMEDCGREDDRDEHVKEPDYDDHEGWQLLKKKRFQHRLNLWEKELKQFLIQEVNVSPKIAEGIPVVPTGDHEKSYNNRKPMHLPDRNNWFNNFWSACCLRVKETKLFLQINQDRMVITYDGDEAPESTAIKKVLAQQPEKGYREGEVQQARIRPAKPPRRPQPWTESGHQEDETVHDHVTSSKPDSSHSDQDNLAEHKITVDEEFVEKIVEETVRRSYGEKVADFAKAAFEYVTKPAKWFVGLFKKEK